MADLTALFTLMKLRVAAAIGLARELAALIDEPDFPTKYISFIILFGIYVCSADGTVDPDEVDDVIELITAGTGFPESAVKGYFNAFEKTGYDYELTEEYLQQYFTENILATLYFSNNNFPNKLSVAGFKDFLGNFASIIASSDGEIHPKEKEAVNNFFEFADEMLSELG